MKKLKSVILFAISLSIFVLSSSAIAIASSENDNISVIFKMKVASDKSKATFDVTLGNINESKNPRLEIIQYGGRTSQVGDYPIIATYPNALNGTQQIVVSGSSMNMFKEGEYHQLRLYYEGEEAPASMQRFLFKSQETNGPEIKKVSVKYVKRIFKPSKIRKIWIKIDIKNVKRSNNPKLVLGSYDYPEGGFKIIKYKHHIHNGTNYMILNSHHVRKLIDGTYQIRLYDKTTFKPLSTKSIEFDL